MGDSGKIEVHILEAICKIEKNTNLIKIGGSPIRNLIFSLPHKKQTFTVQFFRGLLQIKNLLENGRDKVEMGVQSSNRQTLVGDREVDRRISFCICSNIQFFHWKFFKTFRIFTFVYSSLYKMSLFAVSLPSRMPKRITYTGCPRRKGQNFGRVFLMLTLR